MDHAELIAEHSKIEQMSPAERIALAKDRRRVQLRKNEERESHLAPPPPRRARLRFTPDVALLEATSRGDAAEVERLLNEGATPNSHNEDGLTPLHQCAIDNNEHILRLLLKHGASVNAQDTEQWTPLHAAACCAHIEICRQLILHNANLLAVNADGNMPYDICDDEATLDLIETQMAAAGVTQETIEEKRGEAERNMLNDMKFLHQQKYPLDARQEDGSTYLHVAAANGYYDVAAFLLRIGVSASIRDNDLWMPIHAASCWGQDDLVELLCEYGGDINAKTQAGETPLDLCEDPQTRGMIVTLQQQEARKRRFGVRDSRRQSRKRKKFESPQQPATAQPDNPLSARSLIRRTSLRDKSGMTLARLEAQQEQSDILRSWSKEDVSSPQVRSDQGSFTRYQEGVNPYAGGGDGPSTSGGNRRESPNKRVLKQKKENKPAMSPDEWRRKLDAEVDDDDERPMNRQGRGRTSSKKKKKRGDNNGGTELNTLRSNGGSTLTNDANGMRSRSSEYGPTSRQHKKLCCCTIC